MTTQITAADIKKILNDELSAARAAFVTEAVEKAEEAAAKKQESLPSALRGTDATLKAFLKDALQSNDGHRAAQGDREAVVLHNDPHKGRGLGFARAVKAMAVAKMGRDTPLDIAKSWAKENRAYEDTVRDFEGAEKRGMTAGAFSAGGALIPTEVAADFIEMLYAQTVVVESGARVIDFKGSLEFGKQTGSATAYYKGEAQNIVPSQPTTGTLSLKARELAALVAISNKLLRQPSVAADTFVRDDLLRVMVLKRDLYSLRGLGTEFSPKGIKNWMASANANAQTGTTLAAKVADLVKVIRLIDESDVALTKGGYVMSPRVMWDLASTLDSNGNFVFMAMIMMGKLFGYDVRRSSQIPNNLGGGTESEVYFAEWPEVILGFDLAMELEAFPNGTFHDGSALVSGISTDQTVIRALENHDVLLRHNKSASMITGVTWGA